LNGRWGGACLVAVAAASLAACAAHAPRRVLLGPGAAVPLETSVPALARPAERREAAAHPVEIHPEFTLAFIEFDDQGRLWSRAELELLDASLTSEARREQNDGVLLIFFAHGWKHDARVCDGNAACFRAYLAQLAAGFEAAARLAGAGVRPPRVVGIYAGWRGRSVTVPILRNLSFWSRKKAAERVGGGEVIELLVHLDQFARAANAGGRERATLIIIGHSFGGTMVYTALANVLKARLVEALHRRGRVPADENVVEGFGNLVVLVNPAFEAALYAPLEDLVGELRTTSRFQSPVLVVVGSETDVPTRLWFRMGRFIDTLFQRAGPRSSRATLTTSVGNYAPFSTHRLDVGAPSAPGVKTARVSGCECRLPVSDLPLDQSRDIARFLTHRQAGELPEEATPLETSPCAEGVVLGSVRLTCGPGVDPSRPIWNIRASDDVVHGHSDFFTRPFLDFLRFVIWDSLTKRAERCAPAD